MNAIYPRTHSRSWNPDVELDQEFVDDLEAALDERPATPRRPLVMCVDDDPRVLLSLNRLLHREPYQLVTIEDPAEALEWVKLCRVDLVMVDQRMPGMSGVDFLDSVRLHSPGTICVMLTGYPDSEAVIAWRDRKIRRLITKPWDNESLMKVIRTLLKEGTRPAAGASREEP